MVLEQTTVGHDAQGFIVLNMDHTEYHRIQVKQGDLRKYSTFTSANNKHSHSQNNRHVPSIPIKIDEQTRKLYDYQLRLIEDQILDVQIKLMGKQKTLLQVG